MGSPTVPNDVRLSMANDRGPSCPQCISARMAVGAVYSEFTLCFSTISQNRLGVGCVGIPSNITVVLPSSKGPYTMYE